jgi:hypothetical protein
VEGDEGVDEPAEVLAVLRNDIAALWADAALRALVTASRTEDRPGLCVVVPFLPFLPRLTDNDADENCLGWAAFCEIQRA